MTSKGAHLLPSFVVLFVIGIVLGSCGPRTVITPIHKDSVFAVRLEHLTGKDKLPVNKGYQHPAPLSLEELATLLGSIRIQYHPGIFGKIVSGQSSKIVPAFSDNEIPSMISGLSQALERATSADRIAFRLQHKRGIFGAGMTTGVLYFKNDRLEVIIGNYRANPPPWGGNNRPGIADPLGKKGGRPFEIIPGNHQKLLPTGQAHLENQWIQIDYKALLADSSRSPDPMPVMKSDEKNEVGIEEKLNTLKRLRDKELITQEDYEKKKAELLNAF